MNGDGQGLDNWISMHRFHHVRYIVQSLAYCSHERSQSRIRQLDLEAIFRGINRLGTQRMKKRR